MVRSYLRWEHASTFGVIGSGTANIVWAPEPASTGPVTRDTAAGRAVVPANDEVLTWDIKKGTLLSRWRDPKCKVEATAILQSRTDPDIFVVGYADGSIRLWDSKMASVVVSFNGHKSAVTALAWDRTGARLASGSKDSHIIVWDIIAEVGIYRLRSHKDQITGLTFLAAPGGEGVAADDAKGDGWLLSTGKDALVKLWDLSTQHCVETHMAHHAECWALAMMPDCRGCITAGSDGEMKVWEINLENLKERMTGSVDCLVERGALYRKFRDRVISVALHHDGAYFAVHGIDKNIEIWRIRSREEVQKALKRKRKRRESKAGEADAGADSGANAAERSAELTDAFVLHTVIRAGGKVRSVDWVAKTHRRSTPMYQFVVLCTNNSLEHYSVASHTEKVSDETLYNKMYFVDLPGHRTDIQALSLSSDDRMLASASNGSLKIWNVRTGACIRTFECGYALCCAFLPGDKIVVIGTKTGELELFDVASSAVIESVKAHNGAVWSLQVQPGGKGLVSGSADRSAKFWDFEIVQEDIPGTKRTISRLRLNSSRVLKVNDDVLCVRFSPNGKLLAVALLDNTVKVFFCDSLRHLLNLYGHKLPVLSMDISSDSKLIVTCSADKNIKLWGLDFGDCHKSIFAHQDSIMQVVFEKDSHYFFSASKDKLVKYWDGDKFENIMKLDGHFGEVLALAMGKVSNVMVSASHDKGIRTWEQTDEPLFLEEEREKELDELYETTFATSISAANSGDDGLEVLQTSKQTTETLMAGERIMEALEIGINDLALMKEYHAAKESQLNLAQPPRNALYIALRGISAERHVLNVIRKIPAASLHDALLVLPFDKAVSLLTFLDIWTAREWNIPLVCRILFFILKTHHKQLVATRTMRQMLDSLRSHLRDALKSQKHEIGFNLAAVKYIHAGVMARMTKDFVDEQEYKEIEERNTRKRAFVTVA